MLDKMSHFEHDILPTTINILRTDVQVQHVEQDVTA
jgi:hypothetical protein